MAASRLQRIGNQFAVIMSDGSKAIAYPTQGQLYRVADNIFGVKTLQLAGDQIFVDYGEGVSEIASMGTHEGLWFVGPSDYIPPVEDDWRWPLDSTETVHVSDEFGGGHTGIDMYYTSRGNLNADLHAVFNGTVRAASFSVSNGNRIKIEADDGSYFGFYHMYEPTPLAVGDIVAVGDRVGGMGGTGTNAGGDGTPSGQGAIHMHFGTSETGWTGADMGTGTMMNPRTYMSDRGAAFPW